MSRRRFLTLVLMVASLSGKSAGAASMSYQATDISLDVPGSSLAGNVALPDLTSGGTVLLGSLAFDNNQVPSSVGDPLPISGPFGFLLEPAQGTGPFLGVTGRYRGYLASSGGPPPRWYGSLTGAVDQVSASPNALPIPEALLDLIDHPGRMHISTTVSASGSQSFINVSLTIDPATAPEPSTLALLLVAAAGVIVRGARRRAR